MNIEKIILLLIDLAGGSIEGKTLIQKQMYFLSIFLREDFGYRPHFYGPYSPKVDDNLLKLKILGFVNEEVLSYGFVDEGGFEVKGFRYSITDSGKEILRNYTERNSTEYKKIEKYVQKLMKNANFNDYISLSIAAKTYYIVKHNGNTRIDDIKGLANKYGWHNISENSINKAFDFLTSFKLIPH